MILQGRKATSDNPIEPVFNLLEGKVRISAALKFRNWFSEFYGIGKNSFHDSEEYTRKEISIETELIRRVSDSFYVGAITDFDHKSFHDIEDTYELADDTIPGNTKYDIMGLGITFINDHRDNRIYTTSGNFQQLKIVQYDKIWGSDHQFTKTYLDLRYFTNLSISHVFAFQTLMETTHKSAPFLNLSQLGEEIRAFRSARYIDNHLILSRVEYRSFPLKPKFLRRFGFVLFLEAGEVNSSFKDFSLTAVKICYGGGFRFSVFPEERMNLAFDLGFSKDNIGIIGFIQT